MAALHGADAVCLEPDGYLGRCWFPCQCATVSAGVEQQHRIPSVKTLKSTLLPPWYSRYVPIRARCGSGS